MVKISFLIPVFNQSEELEECISRIVKYSGSDIEIVVSDDNSTENLKAIVDGFNDERIKWYKNTDNMGLDGNMLFGMSKCIGEFIFLLRTRDYIIPGSIPGILSIIDAYPEVVYITGTCLDDDGLPRRLYKEKIYKKGREALEAHYSAHFHPSGSAFKRDLIDVSLLEKYYVSVSEPRFWFMADQILRLYLATKGDFYFVGHPIWIYTYTDRNAKLSVHKKAKNGIYAPEYTYQRYESEMRFIDSELDDSLKTEIFCKCFVFWLTHATWNYFELATDRNLQAHYGNTDIEVDVDKERDSFVEYSCKVEKSIQIDDCFNEFKKNAIIKNIEYQHTYLKQDERKKFVATASESTIHMLEDLKSRYQKLDDLLFEDGYRTVGIYGMGYLGKIVWNELKNSKKVKVKYICDKLYSQNISLDDGVMAILPNTLKCYPVEICLVTPVQSAEEIITDIDNRVNCVSVRDYIANHAI